MKKIILRLIILILLVCIAIAAVLGCAGYSMYKKALEEVSFEDKLSEIRGEADYTDIDDVAKMYKDAVVAVEDHRFYKHCGIDLWAKLP